MEVLNEMCFSYLLTPQLTQQNYFVPLRMVVRVSRRNRKESMSSML